jgi:hypothetical protein
VYLHNFETDEWDQKGTSAGESTMADGWGMWEEWRMKDNWPTLPKLYSRELSVCDGVSAGVMSPLAGVASTILRGRAFHHMISCMSFTFGG